MGRSFAAQTERKRGGINLVEMKNIAHEGDYIVCNYYPEGNLEAEGRIKIHIPSKKIVEQKGTVYDDSWEEDNKYANKAMRCLLDILKEQKELPKETYTMWY
jgi:hypothetical protein